MPPSGAYAYGAGVVADTLLTFLKEAPCHVVLSHFSSGAGDPHANAPHFCVEAVMNAKTIGLILSIFLLTIPVLACGGIGGGSDDGGSGGATSRVGGDDEVLKLLPEDTTLINVASADAITGGSVPESMTELFEGAWEDYSLGGEDEIVTVDDVGKVVWAFSPEGGIVMVGGSRIDFAAIGQWLADVETNIGKTSYQGRDMWGNDDIAMVLLQSDGYLLFGDTDAVKEVLKVKARGSGSLADDSENSLKKAYEDAAADWYVSASENCDAISSDLRSCEAYSVTAAQGKEDYLVNITYRLTFRSEQRAESQALDLEDWIEDRGYRWDIDEVKADGVSVEARMSGDEEDFTTRWIGTDNVYTPPPVPTAAPEPESRNTNQGGPASEPGATSPPVSSSGTLAAFRSVSARYWHTCGVKTDGSVACWGADDYGEATPPGGSFSSVSTGSRHTCGVKTGGSVACWGNDDYGRATPPSGSFSSVNAGGRHTCGVRTDDSVACWGADEYGEATPLGGSFSSVSAGALHTCGVRTGGSVACWGRDHYGQATPPSGSFSSVSAGDWHTCGVKTGGSVACWGWNEYGEATPPGGSFSSVSAGGNYTCGVKTGGSVACWGDDGYGEATPPGGSFSSVSAGAKHTCGVKTGGSVACWGDDAWGQATPPSQAR